MDKWNRLDRFIAWFRYRKAEAYVPKGGIVCDIGCGREAAFLRRISKRIKRGYGFDNRITANSYENIELRNNRDCNGIPLPKNSCDRVFLLAVIEHLDNPVNTLLQINDICKTGGRIVLTTPTRLGKPILEFMAFRLHSINEAEIKEHKHYYTKTEIANLFARTGFQLDRYRKFLFGVNSIASATKK